jgi:hypothetical protein
VRIFGLCSPLLEARVGFDIGIYRSGSFRLDGAKKTHRDADSSTEQQRFGFE